MALARSECRDRVLDRERLQHQLTGEVLQDAVVRVADVDPGQAVRLLEVVRNPREVEVLSHDLAIAPNPAPNRAVGVVIHDASLRRATVATGLRRIGKSVVLLDTAAALCWRDDVDPWQVIHFSCDLMAGRAGSGRPAETGRICSIRRSSRQPSVKS